MSTLNRPMALQALNALAFGPATLTETLDRLEYCIVPDPRITALETALNRAIPGAGLSAFEIRTLIAGGDA